MNEKRKEKKVEQNKTMTARELIKLLRQDHDALDLPVYRAIDDGGVSYAPTQEVIINQDKKFFVKGEGRRHHTKGFLIK